MFVRSSVYMPVHMYKIHMLIHMEHYVHVHTQVTSCTCLHTCLHRHNTCPHTSPSLVPVHMICVCIHMPVHKSVRAYTLGTAPISVGTK